MFISHTAGTQDSKSQGDSQAGDITIKAAGRSWLLKRPADLETLWQDIASEKNTPPEFLQDERLPYWVELWLVIRTDFLNEIVHYFAIFYCYSHRTCNISEEGLEY